MSYVINLMLQLDV